MLIDLRRIAGEPLHHAETLIVGSGAVGLTMAVELARAGRDVILLEAGTSSVEADSQAYFKSARWRHYRLDGLHLGRFRVLGGTTNFWGGQLVRFDPIVFEERPWVADIGWPIRREELDRFYESSYRILGMDRHLEDDEVWRRLQITPPAAGDALESFFTAWTPESNLARLFAREINSCKHLHLFTSAPVVALDLDENGRRVTSVVVRAGAATHRFSADHVILANGTIEIARLLRLPLADGRSAPWGTNRWLGRGFVDHVDCFGGEVATIDKKRFHDLFDNVFFDKIKYVPKLKLSEKAQRERKLLGISAHFYFNSSMEEHLANAKVLARSLLKGRLPSQLVGNPRELISMARVAFPLIARYLRHRRMYNLADRGIKLRLTSEQLPLTESAIHLTDQRDDLGMPTIEMDWRIDGRELETMAVFGESIAAHLERHRLAHVTLEPALMARDPRFLERLDDSNHHMGMARMANAAAEGVVDRDLRVFGVSNLYVAGAAVFPTTGFGNPTFTAIALGLRLANSILHGDSKAPGRAEWSPDYLSADANR